MMEVYGLSGPFAALLAGGGIIKCGNGFRLNLEDLAAHNKLEHDASMVNLESLACLKADICKGASRYQPRQPRRSQSTTCRSNGSGY